jgi:hypothetical protein
VVVVVGEMVVCAFSIPIEQASHRLKHTSVEPFIVFLVPEATASLLSFYLFKIFPFTIRRAGLTR